MAESPKNKQQIDEATEPNHQVNQDCTDPPDTADSLLKYTPARRNEIDFYALLAPIQHTLREEWAKLERAWEVLHERERNITLREQLLEERMKKVRNDEATQQEQAPPTNDEIIELNVGGCYFSTFRSTLTREDSMLSAMFSGRYAPRKDACGRYFIDRDGKMFRYILNYLRDGTIPPFNSQNHPDKLKGIVKEADFFQLQGLLRHLQELVQPPAPKWRFTESHPYIQISNDGLTALNTSASGEYVIARCGENMIHVSQETREYFEVRVRVPMGKTLGIGLANAKMQPSGTHSTGFSAVNQGVGLYLDTGNVYKYGVKVASNSNVRTKPEATLFGWLLDGYTVQFYCEREPTGPPTRLDAHKEHDLYPVVILVGGCWVKITSDTPPECD